MMHSSSIPESSASSAMIWMVGFVMPSRSTRGNISFCTVVEAGYCRVPRPAAVITALRTCCHHGHPPDFKSPTSESKRSRTGSTFRRIASLA